MSGHTPGPWRFKTDQITGDCGITTDGTGVFVEAFADIRRAREHNCAEAQANARLIAAAPDLLVACQTMIEALKEEHRVPHGANDDWLHDTMGSAVSSAYFAIRDAVTKAESK